MPNVVSRTSRILARPFWLFCTVSLASFLYLIAITPPHTVVSHDTIRDLLLARDCFSDCGCIRFGPPAGLGHFLHGATWSLLVALLGQLGLSIASISFLFTTMAASATGLLVVLSRRLDSDITSASLTGVVFLVGLSICFPAGQLLQETAYPLPLVAFTGAAIAYARHGQLPWAILAGLFLGISIDIHGAAIALLPGFMIGIICARPRGRNKFLSQRVQTH